MIEALIPFRMEIPKRISEQLYDIARLDGEKSNQKAGNYRPKNPISVQPLISYLVIPYCFKEKMYEDFNYQICSALRCRKD